MQPIRCKGGYALPIKSGKFTICGIRATVSNPNMDSKLILVDNSSEKVQTEADLEYPTKRNTDDYNNARVITLKGIGGQHAIISDFFPEGIKVNDGLTISVLENIEPGEIYAYER